MSPQPLPGLMFMAGQTGPADDVRKPAAAAGKADYDRDRSDREKPRADSPDSGGGGYFTLSDSDGGSNPGTESPLEEEVTRSNAIYKIYRPVAAAAAEPILPPKQGGGRANKTSQARTSENKSRAGRSPSGAPPRPTPPKDVAQAGGGKGRTPPRPCPPKSLVSGTPSSPAATSKTPPRSSPPRSPAKTAKPALPRCGLYTSFSTSFRSVT